MHPSRWQYIRYRYIGPGAAVKWARDVLTGLTGNVSRSARADPRSSGAAASATASNAGFGSQGICGQLPDDRHGRITRMSYAIDERNPERQQLLNALLEPPTRAVLARLPALSGGRVLDLGAGQGNTTRCLADVLHPAECIGLEYDPALVDYAQAHPDNPPAVRFQQGDATRLPFPDGSFDVVFCRYLLLHMADPVRVVREMLRVVRPGGFAMALEGDFTQVSRSHPPCDALATVHKAWNGLFPNPQAGATLVHTFREAGATRLEAGAWTMIEHDDVKLRRIYRLSAEATGPLAARKGILTDAQVREMIADLIRLEDDPASVVVMFPGVWVIATRRA
jgi:SAM-dependent methyltransferase